MNPKFSLLAALLMSRISVFQATVQCPTAGNSIGGMFLSGHTFKTTKVGWVGGCYLKCGEEVKCQSYNFVIGDEVCELNNRTKEARPEDFKPDQTRLYMKSATNRGTLQLLFRVSLSFKMQPSSFLDFAGKNFVLGRKLPMKAARPPGELGVILKAEFFSLLTSALSTAVVQTSSHGNTRK